MVTFKWGAMIFTSTMAADILFYSLCEWMLYGNDPYITEMGGMQKWAPTYCSVSLGGRSRGAFLHCNLLQHLDL